MHSHVLGSSNTDSQLHFAVISNRSNVDKEDCIDVDTGVALALWFPRYVTITLEIITEPKFCKIQGTI